MKIILLLLLFLVGCADTGLTPEEIIVKCKKCQEQGMNVSIHSDILGKPRRVECIPTSKQLHP